ncbi:MAG: Bro-N domain-containing protein [Verrucomicrobia bacterium]|nr:Bro-N domain-containing protein [Verrucomicrobiota bacterium]
MSHIVLFEERHVRRAWNPVEEKWYFALVDVIAILTGSPNPQVCWRVLKKRLRDEGNQTVTNCNALKLTASDGKQRLTDVADSEQLLRLIQSIPSPKAEPFKLWLARVGSERLAEIQNPEVAARRMREIYGQRTSKPSPSARPKPSAPPNRKSADSLPLANAVAALLP